MDFETQIDHFNDEILELSRSVQKMREDITIKWYGYLGVGILKWTFIASAGIALLFQIGGLITSGALFLLGIMFSKRHETLEEELYDMTYEYDDKILEVVAWQEKKVGLAEVWEKDESETMIKDEEKQEEYNNNMPTDQYVLNLLMERAALEMIKDDEIEDEKEKGLRKVFK